MQMPPVRFAGENGLCLFPSLQLSDAAHPDPAGDVLYPRLLSAYAVRGLRLWESERLDLAREPDRSGLAALFLEGCECFDVGSDGLDEGLLHLGAEHAVFAFVHRVVLGFHEDVFSWLVGERVSAGDAFVP